VKPVFGGAPRPCRPEAASRFQPESSFFGSRREKPGPRLGGFAGVLEFGGLTLAVDATRVSGMAGRYAQALFALSEERGTTDKTVADLAAFAELAASSADMQRFIKSPVFSAEEQVRALGAILDKAGITGIAANFLKLVAAKQRLFAISDMIRDFTLLNDARKGVSQANVTVAEALKPEHALALRSALIDISGGGDIKMDFKIDPSIIGGMIVQLGSRMVDSSLKTKLNSIRARMKEAG
jgi:F-type H+-transporting ATPase subunit delta